MSLAMNGLLVLAVIFGLREKPASPPRSAGTVLPQANAAVQGSNLPATTFPQLGDRQYLNYQQWVDLLRQEAAAAQDAAQLTVLLGDSISLWFPRTLLPGRRTWLNQAISGEQSAALVKRLNALDDADVKSFFLMIGINDLLAGKSDTQIAANIEAAIAYLRQTHPEADIVVQSILPHSAHKATWEGRDRLLLLPNQRIQSVNQTVASLAPKYGAHYLALYPLFANGEGALRSDLTTDGLHLNERGYLVWRTAIALLLTTDLSDDN